MTRRLALHLVDHFGPAGFGAFCKQLHLGVVFDQGAEVVCTLGFTGR